MSALHYSSETTRLGLANGGNGHEDQFPPPKVSAGCGFGKETIARRPRNGREAPIPTVGRRVGARGVARDERGTLGLMPFRIPNFDGS